MSDKSDKLDKLIPNELVKKLDSQVLSVISSTKIEGFEMAFKISSAIQALKELLTSEYMKPIMAMQNNKLGFKTDKSEGYPEPIVKNCLIEAVLTGVQPFGNQFNIIAGGSYITKEGFGYLLEHFNGLKYEIIPSLPRINAEKTSAAIVMKIKWTLSGKPEESREIDFPIRMNQYMGTDAVIGKATRKARAWLFNSISGFEVADGDVLDVDSSVVETKKINKEKVDNLYADKEKSDELFAQENRTKK